jgi:hypothetical protein
MGVKDLHIDLSTSSGADLDIQLFDQGNRGDTDKHTYDRNAAIIAYNLGDATGLGDGPGQGSAAYGGCTYSYSGFNGDGTNFGNEWIRIACATDTTLMMKVFAMEAGAAEVTYSYWN